MNEYLNSCHPLISFEKHRKYLLLCSMFREPLAKFDLSKVELYFCFLCKYTLCLMEVAVYVSFGIVLLLIVLFFISWFQIGCFWKMNCNKGAILQERSNLGWCYCYFCNYWTISEGVVLYVAEGQNLKYGSNLSNGISSCGHKYVPMNDKCPVCLEDFKNNCEVIRLACYHGFHSPCILNWIKDKIHPKCPLCTASINAENISEIFPNNIPSIYGI